MLIQTVAPTAEPITLIEVKEHMSMLENDHDNKISTLIKVATKSVEDKTNRQLMSATFELYADNFVTKLKKNPIQSIKKIEYMDENEVYQILNSSLYYLYEENGIGMIKYTDIPTLPTHKKAVKITFICGYTTVPEPIKQYLNIAVESMFETTGDKSFGVQVYSLKEYTECLLNPYKVKEF